MQAELYERLQERRAIYESAVRSRYGQVFGHHDAEDLVSTALHQVLTTSTQPAPGMEDAWFRTMLSHVAVDELRRRHGRRQRFTSDTETAAFRRAVLLSELAETGFEIADADPEESADAWAERIDRDEDRDRVEALVRQALDELTPDELRLLTIRHVELPGVNRSRCANAAGLTEDAWRHRYGRAWDRFVALISSAEPSPRCVSIRATIGALDSGDLSGEAAEVARTRIDIHVVECAACRVFARDGYRVLVLVPAVPASRLALELWADRAVAVVDRSPGEIAAGSGAATAGGAGLFAIFGGGGAAGGGAKALLALCGASALTASICGALIAGGGALDNPATSRAAAPTPTPTASPSPTPAPRRATPTPTPARSKPSRAKPSAPTRTTTSAEQEPPAAVPSGSTGREFDPVPENSRPQPAPVPAGVGDEFAP